MPYIGYVSEHNAIFFLIAKYPLNFFTKRLIAPCVQITPSGRQFSYQFLTILC